MIEFQPFIEKITALTMAEDLIVLGKEASDTRSHFEDFLLEQERLQQVAKMEASERGDVIADIDFESPKESFYLEYKKFQEITA